MNFDLPPTEQTGPIRDLETLSIAELTAGMQSSLAAVEQAVTNALPAANALIEALVQRMKQGGRLFYIGAGTSGRLGVIDASECPPTFGIDPGVVIGLIAGGDGALRIAVEGAEDNSEGAWSDLQAFQPNTMDTVVGIAASGRTPYVIGGLQQARDAGLLTGCIACNPDTEVERVAEYALVAVTGPEFITGSTRLNAGTATKLLLNMITTATMIQLGHVRGSQMVDMRPSNKKLVERGVRMIIEATGLDADRALSLLSSTGSVRAAIDQAIRDARA
ncbi:MAG: N-acetylmuramic acid 6-phosphate etherase [Flavobacteriales bacterium]